MYNQYSFINNAAPNKACAKRRKDRWEMNKKIPEEINIDNIRSREQLEATIAWWEAGKTSGCPTWCNNREEQKSPVVFETNLWEIRQEADEYKKPGAERWFIILKRHASLDELLPVEGAELVHVKQRMNKEFDINCYINRRGPKEYTASSLSDAHYYEIAVKTTPGVPYKETLVKDLAANKERLEKRAEEITKE